MGYWTIEISLQIGLLQRKIDKNMENYRRKRYEKAVGNVCKKDGKTKFLVSPGHVEVILLLAYVNMDNY